MAGEDNDDGGDYDHNMKVQYFSESYKVFSSFPCLYNYVSYYFTNVFVIDPEIYIQSNHFKGIFGDELIFTLLINASFVEKIRSNVLPYLVGFVSVFTKSTVH